MLTAVDIAPYLAGALGVSGVAVWAARRRELILRWCTWLVTAPLVGGAFWFGAAGAALLAAALGGVAAWEYGRLARLPVPDRLVIGGAVAGLSVAAWLEPGLLPRVLIVAALAVAAAPILTGDAADGGRRLAYGGFGLLWLGALAGLVLLGPAAFALVLAVSVADVAAWCGGKGLGGPALSPLSPQKRWGGVLAGGVAGLGVLWLLGALTPALAAAVLVGAPLGDLLESALKRGAGVKDAGRWLPGFGGLLDRIDSLLLAIPIAVALS